MSELFKLQLWDACGRQTDLQLQCFAAGLGQRNIHTFGRIAIHVKTIKGNRTCSQLANSGISAFAHWAQGTVSQRQHIARPGFARFYKTPKP